MKRMDEILFLYYIGNGGEAYVPLARRFFRRSDLRRRLPSDTSHLHRQSVDCLQPTARMVNLEESFYVPSLQKRDRVNSPFPFICSGSTILP